MKLRWSVLLLSGVLLFGCGQSQSDNPAFKPVLNPNPKYFVTYKGFIDPSLHHVVKLTFLTVYQTTNPKCRFVPNPLSGNELPREKLLYTHVKPDKAGHYEYQVPMDKYIPGYCGWQIAMTNFNDDGSNDRFYFNSGVWYSAKHTKDVVNIKKEVVNNECYKNECVSQPSSNNVVVKHEFVPYNKDHIFEINYYRGKK